MQWAGAAGLDPKDWSTAGPNAAARGASRECWVDPAWLRNLVRTAAADDAALAAAVAKAHTTRGSRPPAGAATAMSVESAGTTVATTPDLLLGGGLDDDVELFGGEVLFSLPRRIRSCAAHLPFAAWSLCALQRGGVRAFSTCASALVVWHDRR